MITPDHGSDRYSFGLGADNNGFGDWLTDVLGLTPGMKAYEDAKRAGVTLSDVVGPTPTIEGAKALDAATQVAAKTANLTTETAKAVVEKRAREAAQEGGETGTRAAIWGAAGLAAVILGVWYLTKRR